MMKMLSLGELVSALANTGMVNGTTKGSEYVEPGNNHKEF